MESPQEQVPAEERRSLATRRAADYFKFKGFGIDAEGHGKQTTLVVLVLILLGVFTYFALQHDNRTSEALTRLEGSILLNAKLTEGLIYLSTKSQEEKERLNLGKPQIIRDLENKGTR